jgi:2-polyprenyl-3-methyl-5-hydroxy-6-metoxy-1,4-benzoquinol methylase
MQDIDKMLQYLSELTAFFNQLKDPRPTPAPEITLPAVAPVTQSPDFEGLRGLVKTAQWPVAVDPALICDETSEADRVARADAILEQLLPVPVKGMRVLDFGCGAGTVAVRAKAAGAATAVGYDLVKQWEGAAPSGVILTTSLDEVRAAGPFDVAILYDVVDHVVEDTPVGLLKKVREVLSPKGTVAMRMHPWTSPHATHLYRKINKAFLHVVFSEDELREMGLEGLPQQQVIHPLATYRGWLAEAGFKVVQETPLQNPVDPFFPQSPVLAARIKARYKASKEAALATGRSFPDYQLSLHFVDYVVEVKA